MVLLRMTEWSACEGWCSVWRKIAGNDSEMRTREENTEQQRHYHVKPIARTTLPRKWV